MPAPFSYYFIVTQGQARCEVESDPEPHVAIYIAEYFKIDVDWQSMRINSCAEAFK